MEQELKVTEQNFKVFQEYIGILKRYKRHIFAIVAVGAILSSVIALKLPHMYKSTATILIDQDSMPEDIVKSIVTNYAEQRIQIINQKIMSSENLKIIINKFNLYQEEQEKSSIHSIVDIMRENTHMEMIGGKQIMDPRSGKTIVPTIGFTLSFDYKTPEIAQQVANEFVSLYLNKNITQRAKVVEEATNFLKQETNRLRSEVSILEEKLAKFKEINAENLPGRNKVNLSRIDRIDQHLRETNNDIRTLTEREFHLKSQLAQLSPNTTSYSLTGERIYGINDRLIALKSEYAVLSSKYSKGHPDLVKLQREISSLQKEVSGSSDRGEYHTKLNEKQAKLALLMDRYSPDHPDVKKLTLEIKNLKKIIIQSGDIESTIVPDRPNNPAYIQLQTQLIDTQAEIKSLRISRADLEGKLLYYEQSMTKSPQVEREYQELMRDYENATLKYREVKAKQMEATMAKSMENITKGNEFILLEPPLIPEDPFKPNRKAIVFLGLLMSIAVALGFVMIKESLNPSIYTSSRLASVIGMQPLVVIPYIEPEKVLLGKQKNIKIALLIVGILLIITILRYTMLETD